MVMDGTGAYTADRAAALSGVPKSTMHWWARNGILVPSVSATKVMLWSYADLTGLRVIYWLRQRKTTEMGDKIPRTSMPTVRRALEQLRSLDLPVWNEGDSSLLVTGSGKVYVKHSEGPRNLDGQLANPDLIDLIAPFTTAEGTTGPDLLRPRPELRIVPGKIGGSPHIVHTRLETRALAALAAEGFGTIDIHRLYPHVGLAQIKQALDLEQQLADNLRLAA